MTVSDRPCSWRATRCAVVPMSSRTVSPSLISSAQRAAMASFSADPRPRDLGERVVAVGGGDGAAVHPAQPALAVELDEVAPDGRLADAEPLGQAGHGGGPVGPQGCAGSAHDVARGAWQ